MCQGCSGIKELIIDHIKNEEKTLTASQVDCLSWIWIVLNFLWMIFTWMILESCCWVHDNHEKCVHEYSIEDCWWWPCVLSPSVWLAECVTALSEGSSHGSWTLDNPGTRRVISYPLTNIWGDQPGHTFPAPGGRCSWSGRAWPCSRCALLMSLARRLGMGQALVSKNSLSTTSSRVERKSSRPFNHSLGSWLIL